MEICDRTFEIVKTHLVDLDYHGPVALSCDDTKLFSALRLFWDKKKECYFLVGACGGPVRVPDVDTAQKALENPEIKKATKVGDIQQEPGKINESSYSDPPMVYDDSRGWDCPNRPCRVANF